MERSAIPICIAILVNQAKNNICQKVNLLWPGSGTPDHIFSEATSQKLSKELIPSFGITANAAAKKIKIIHGAAMFANLDTYS